MKVVIARIYGLTHLSVLAEDSLELAIVNPVRKTRNVKVVSRIVSTIRATADETFVSLEFCSDQKAKLTVHGLHRHLHHHCWDHCHDARGCDYDGQKVYHHLSFHDHVRARGHRWEEDHGVKGNGPRHLSKLGHWEGEQLHQKGEVARLL